jgi:hypothetical protein
MSRETHERGRRGEPFRASAAIPIAFFMLLAATASASHQEGGGASLTVGREEYFYLTSDGETESAVFRFVNHGPHDAVLPSANPFEVWDEEGPVYLPGSVTRMVFVPPGAIYEQTWEFDTNCRWLSPTKPSCLGLALPGRYTVVWRHYETDASGELTDIVELTAGFRIRGSL